MKPSIFVALSTFSESSPLPMKLLKDSGFDYSLNMTGRRLTAGKIVNMAKDADVIIAGVEPYDASVLESLKRLKCISRCGSGIDNIDLEKARETNLTIKNTPDAVCQPVAELTIAMIFDLLRHLSYHNNLMHSRQWRKKPGNMLAGKRVGIIGLGRIGRRVAAILTRLNADVYGYDIVPDHGWAKENRVKIVSRKGLLKNSDIVTIHVSNIAGREFIFGKAEIQEIKKGALLINTSRGNVVDEKALYDALKARRLKAAALDVYADEPYNGPLCDLDNVVLTPHIATLTEESRVRMETEAVQNAIDFLAGR